MYRYVLLIWVARELADEVVPRRWKSISQNLLKLLWGEGNFVLANEGDTVPSLLQCGKVGDNVIAVLGLRTE